MTEDEAKSKWCPMARSTGWNDGVGSANRDHRGSWTSSECCVASACMAWRWNHVKNEAFVPLHPMVSTLQPHPADIASPWKHSDTDGYCGLAGRL